MPEWERAARQQREADACKSCGAWLPNHFTGCDETPVPDPDAERCGCGFIAGSLGCRMRCGGDAA